MVKENIDSKLLDLIAPESIAYWSLLGIEVESAVQDDIKLGLSMRPELGTRLPEIIHGGAIGSLIDAAAGAMTSTLRQEDDETWVGQATIDMNITFLTCVFFSLSFFNIFKAEKISVDSDWLDINNVNIKELVDENKIVFVDITADWCATCQFNKINVINSSIIMDEFEKYNIIKIRGDWTRPNKKIQEYLNFYNRYGIPFNAMYNNNYPEGIIFSELLTKSEIMKTIKLLNED